MSYFKIRLDVDNELQLIEDLLYPYIERNNDIAGNMFLPTLRYPVYNVSLDIPNYERSSIIKKIPELSKYNNGYINKYLSPDSYLPYLTIEPILNYSLSTIYREYKDTEDYKINRLNNRGENFLYYVNLSIEDVLEEFDIWGYPEDIYIRVEVLVYRIIYKIRQYTDTHKYHVFELDYKTDIIYLIDKGHVKAYRFDEYLINKE